MGKYEKVWEYLPPMFAVFANRCCTPAWQAGNRIDGGITVDNGFSCRQMLLAGFARHPKPSPIFPIYRSEDRGGILQHHTLYRRGSASAPGFTLLRRGKQEEGCPIIELGQGRGETQGSCGNYQDPGSTGAQNGSNSRRSSNRRHGARGPSQMTVPTDL